MAMAEQDPLGSQFNAMTARLLRREALRRAAEELNTTSKPGLESVLARISAEVTAEAVDRIPGTRATAAGVRGPAAAGTPPGSGSDDAP
jgi:phage shock protein A